MRLIDIAQRDANGRDIGWRYFWGFGNTKGTWLSQSKCKLDICNIAVIVFENERRHSLFDRRSKAACLCVDARVVAIEGDRFSTGR